MDEALSNDGTNSREDDLLRQRVRDLQRSVFAEPDPSSSDLLPELLKAQAELREKSPSVKAPGHAEQEEPDKIGNTLGRETTKLIVGCQVLMDPLPTGVYQLMNPETHPLLRVEVENDNLEIRRVCVKAFIEGLSAQAVKTIEIPPKKKAKFNLLPTLLPDKVPFLSQVQRATLHVIVENLDGKLECHDTHVITCLSRNSSFNSVRDPKTGQIVDLSHYYGAWVTPNVDCVQERIRSAAARMPGEKLPGYQGDLDNITKQVEAIYNELKEANIAYVNSVIDYGATDGQVTQRTRLPRETLSDGNANCIDGTVLFASLMEGISLNPSIVLVPGHAIVGWETSRGSDEWRYLETTMIGTSDFEAAHASGQSLYERYKELDAKQINEHPLNKLRAQNIWPME